MQKSLCWIAVLVLPFVFPMLGFAAEECPQDHYPTRNGSCYPVRYGQTENGGFYTIAIPDGWMPNKGLVIWNHGLQSYLGEEEVELLAARLVGLVDDTDTVIVSGEVEPRPGLGPLADIVLSRGYAMAASSYLQTGWAVFDSHLANAELYRRFLEIAVDFGPGAPSPFYLFGGSLGGIVSLRDIEEDLIPQPDGSLLLCGAVAGAENWHNAYDLRMITESICLEGDDGKFPAPWYETPGLGSEIEWISELNSCTALIARILTESEHDELQREIDDLRARKDAEGNIFREADLQQRIGRREAEQAIALELWEQLSSNRQVENYKRIQQLAPTHSALMFMVDMFYGSFLLPRMINETGKLNGLNPFHNVAVNYGDEQVNRDIVRSIGLPAARRALAQNYTPSGAIGDTRIISIHTSKDGIVSVENQSALQSLVAPEQLTVGVVAESVPSHCDFRESEVIAAWNLLQEWVEDDGNQPDAEALQDECRAVVTRAESDEFPQDWDRAPDNQLHPGNRCRYAPEFEIGSQVQLYPRDKKAESVGTNVFDAATGVISVGEAEVTLEGDKSIRAFDLQLIDSANLVFTSQNPEQLSVADQAWQHRALVDQQMRFYLPDMSVRNDPNFDSDYNVYMQIGEDMQFKFLDYEPADVKP
ncbi:MAG: hypothetical protein OXE78_08205 [Gammaproteobacteria bacterium]|nr:hypothetical protein [Gammaproteobacteria bacterium]